MNSSLEHPTFIAENDKLRSLHIRDIFHKECSTKISNSKITIPKQLIQFWHNLDELPDDVQNCIDSWCQLENKGFKRILFDNQRARNFIEKSYSTKYVKAFDKCHHPAMRSDYFRLCYLLKHGGFYVDTDEYYNDSNINIFYKDNLLKLQPLCYDIELDSMIDQEHFMDCNKLSKDWIFYVNNNPIISPPNHPLIYLALERATKIILSSSGIQKDIQSTTGPGNISASLVKHSISTMDNNLTFDFQLISNWENSAEVKWDLKYRKDARNWRRWKKQPITTNYNDLAFSNKINSEP